jgi:hypothetical protein
MRKLAVGCVVAAALAALGAAWWLRLLTLESHTGYFNPAFSHDGRFVHVIVRETTGLTWGFGWEHFTPPAHAYPLSDRISLVRFESESGKAETLESWSSTPVLHRVISEYRGRVFNTMHASVRPGPGATVRYEIEIAIPVVPSSDVHRLSGSWAPDEGARRRGEWRRGDYAGAGTSEPVVSGETEVFALSGPESYPCAVVLLDHRVMTTRVLVKSAACAGRYPDGPPITALLEVSRKKDIERVAEVARVRDKLVASYRSEGASEIEALLRSTRALEDSGYLPKSPRIVAHRLGEHDIAALSDLPLFAIAEAEMASGIFSDIEKALSAPGGEIDKSMGAYVVHNDYASSRKLNAHLASGARQFLVRFRGETYRVEIRHAR